jgi:hypothetical protein
MMKNLGIVLTIAGIVAAVWGFTYTDNNTLESIGADLGMTTDTFHAADIAGPTGVIVAVIGIVLLIINMRK